MNACGDLLATRRFGRVCFFFFFDVKEGPIMGFQKTGGMLEAKLPAGVLKLILPLIPSKGTMTNNN